MVFTEECVRWVFKIGAILARCYGGGPLLPEGVKNAGLEKMVGFSLLLVLGYSCMIPQGVRVTTGI